MWPKWSENAKDCPEFETLKAVTTVLTGKSTLCTKGALIVAEVSKSWNCQVSETTQNLEEKAGTKRKRKGENIILIGAIDFIIRKS